MKLSRYYRGVDCTLGILTDPLDAKFLLHTLELPWKGNQRNVSCIPEGVYRVTPYSGSRFIDVYKINDVPNRTAILLHYGNTADDIEGCILVGRQVGELSGIRAVLNSRPAMEDLSKHIGDSDFTLYINNV